MDGDRTPRVAEGIEIGEAIYCPEGARQLLDTLKFDFVIGSLHYVDGHPDFYYINYSTADYHALFTPYFGELLMKHVTTADFDVMGHITYPFREMQKQGITPPLDRYWDGISAALKVIIEKGRGIEINMSPVWAENDPMPDLRVLRRYKELGGEILTVGSDDHKCLYAPKLPKLGLEVAKAAGFKYFTAYKGRKPEMIKFK